MDNNSLSTFGRQLTHSHTLQQANANQLVNPPLQQDAPSQLGSHKGYINHYERIYNLPQLLSIILHRKWTIILTTLLILTLVSFFTFLATPVYRASSTIEISRNSLDAISFNDTQSLRFDDKEFYKTQHGLLRNPTLVKKVMRKLNPKEISMLGANSDNGVNKRKLEKAFLSKITISPLTGSSLVAISYDNTDPQLATKITNSYVAEFIKLNVEKKQSKSSYTREILIDKVSEVERKLENSESLLDQYAASNNIIKYDESETVKLFALKQLEEMLTIAEKESIENKGHQKHAQGRSSSVKVMNDPVIQELKKQKVKLLADYKEMQQTFKPTYPLMLNLQKRIQKVTQEINREKKALLTSNINFANKNLEVSNEKVLTLKNKVEKLKADLMNAQGKSLEYNKIKRKVSTYQALYGTLLKRLNEVTVEGNAVVNNISIVNIADIPLAPVYPKKKLNIVLGSLLGLILGLLLAFLMERRNSHIYSESEVSQISTLPILGKIPRVKPEKGKDTSLLLYSKKSSPLVEALRTLRTNLMYSDFTGARPPRSILITSPSEREGKTSTSINLACAYILAGKKALIIDSNLRKPAISKRIFKQENKLGLSDYLLENANFQEIIRHSHIPRLSIIPSGHLPANPVELLSHERMQQLITFGQQEFDLVIIDGCPIDELSDSIIVSRLVDATLLTIQLGNTNINNMTNALHRLASVQSNLLGLIVTNATPKDPYNSQVKDRQQKQLT